MFIFSLFKQLFHIFSLPSLHLAIFLVNFLLLYIMVHHLSKSLEKRSENSPEYFEFLYAFVSIRSSLLSLFFQTQYFPPIVANRLAILQISSFLSLLSIKRSWFSKTSYFRFVFFIISILFALSLGFTEAAPFTQHLTTVGIINNLCSFISVFFFSMLRQPVTNKTLLYSN